MNCVHTMTKGGIWDYRHMYHSFLRAGSVMELTIPGVRSEAFSNSDQLEDWLREDDDIPSLEYQVRFLAKEPACL